MPPFFPFSRLSTDDTLIARVTQRYSRHGIELPSDPSLTEHDTKCPFEQWVPLAREIAA